VIEHEFETLKQQRIAVGPGNEQFMSIRQVSLLLLLLAIGQFAN